MKKLSSIFLLLILFSFKEEELQYRLNDFKLKGKVKTIRIHTSVFIDILPEFHNNTDDFHHFDEQGYKTGGTFTREGKLLSENTYRYSAKRDTLENTYADGKTIFRYLPDGKQLDHVSYVLKNGEWVLGEDIVRYKYAGNTVEQYMYKNGKLQNKIVSTYDKHGNLIEDKEFKSSKSPVEYTTLYKYDRRGNCIKTIYQSMHPKSNGYKTATYDDKDNVLETYMEYGIIGPLKITYKYEYDTMDNWIKQSVYMDDSLYNITTRTIEYY